MFTNMSVRMVENIRDDLEFIPNAWTKDVEDAQQHVVEIIRNLEDRNEIVILKDVRGKHFGFHQDIPRSPSVRATVSAYSPAPAWANPP